MIELTVFVSVYKKTAENLNRMLMSIPRYAHVEVDVDGWVPDYDITQLEGYKSRQSIKLYQHEENHGLGWIRNRQLERCKSKYLMWVDADDYLFPEFVPLLYDMDSDIVVTPVKFLTNGVEYIENRNLNVKKGGLTYFIIPSIIFKTEFVRSDERLRFNETGRVFEDILFSIYLTMSNPSVADFHNPIYCYVNDSDVESLSRPKNYRKAIDDTIWFCEKIIEESKSYEDRTLFYVRLVEDLIRVLRYEELTYEDRLTVIDYIKPYKFFKV